ncbi:hypothetical protein HDV05_003379 [Chytridiales sp. JEL 0842]|nr:hypothetical protein HDV05_003379 [Chytridiales sp. JEL 0842]
MAVLWQETPHPPQFPLEIWTDIILLAAGSLEEFSELTMICKTFRQYVWPTVRCRADVLYRAYGPDIWKEVNRKWLKCLPPPAREPVLLLLAQRGVFDDANLSLDRVGWGIINFPILHYAAEYQMPALTYELLKRGADPNIVCKRSFKNAARDSGRKVQCNDEDDPTPLFVAAKTGNVELAKHLLDFGADVNYVNTWRQTPLNRAAARGHVDMISFLADNGGIVSPWEELPMESPLFEAAAYRKVDTLRALLERGADPNVIRQRNRWAPTALHTVLFKYNFLKVNGEVLNKDQQESAAQTLECVRVLVNSGANVNVISADGFPLDIAKRKNLVQVVAFLESLA